MINSINPKHPTTAIPIKDQITTNSIEVAKSFGKRHKDVLEAIRKKFDPDKFFLTDISISGRKRNAYKITREGFVLLVSGFKPFFGIVDIANNFLCWFNEMANENRKSQEMTMLNPIPELFNIPVTDHGQYNQRPWLSAQILHKDLYDQLRAKYAEIGASRNYDVMAQRKLMFYEAEEFAVLMDYLILKMPRYVEAILKLQLAAMENVVFKTN